MSPAARVGGLAAGLALLACAPALRSGQGSTAIDARALAREADAEVARGCYECLRSAAVKYEAAVTAGGGVPRVRVAGAWVLVAARERELGLPPSDALIRARGQRSALAEAANEIIDAYLNVLETLPHRIEGVSKEALGGSSQAIRAMLNLIEKAAESRAIETLRQASIQGDAASEYLLRSLECAYNRNVLTASGVVVERPALLPPNPQPSNLLAFLAATCGNRRDPARDGSVLEALLQAETRFHEAHYFLGHLRLLERKLVSGEREFLEAANGVPRMTAAWATLGATRLALEEYDWAAADIGRALDIEPRQREALLNHARALNYAGRYEEALVPAQRLIDFGAWFVSDANFWLAFSELQLGRLQDADRHVREAKRTNPMNADTARLSGLVAYRLAEFERAQGEFELALSKGPTDCESQLHLGLIHGQKERYDLSVAAFMKARDCFDATAVAIQSRAGEIEASTLPEARKETARARLAQKVRSARRARAGASLGAAEGETQRGAWEAALAHLEEAANESELGPRVTELQTRIAALKARRQ